MTSLLSPNDDAVSPSSDEIPGTSNKESTESPPSPNAMANAVVQEAMAQEIRNKQAHQRRPANDDQDAVPAKTARHGPPFRMTIEDQQQPERLVGNNAVDVEVQQQLESVWEEQQRQAEETRQSEAAYSKTRELLFEKIDVLIQCGLHAYHQGESATQDLVLAKDELTSKDRELQRLKKSEQESKLIIQNLTRAVEASKSDARDLSRVAQAEARLRADLTHMRSERDEAWALASESKRRMTLLEEELSLTKTRLTRVTQEKIRVERDSRAALSLAKSLDNHASSDVEFYKRKTSELTTQLQAQHTLVAEQKHQIVDLRRQLERHLSQNRLAALRTGTTKQQ